MNYPRYSIISLFILIFSSIVLPSKSQETLRCIYVSPVPGAKYVQPENNIIIRFSNKIDRQDLSNILINIEGNIRQEYPADVHLLKDMKSLIIQPEISFQPGETIRVRMRARKNNSLNFEEQDFCFNISNKKLHPANYSFNKELLKNQSPHIPAPESPSREINDYIEKFALPQDFPPMVIGQKSNPNPGYFFMSCIGPAKYNIIVDNNITPIYYQKYNERIMGLDLQEANGYLTFSKGINNTFIELDSTYKQRRTYTAGNGYFTDFHELLITEDSTYWLMIYDPQIVDMSQVVEGGNPNAIVIGLVIQKLNQEDEVIFQWRSWDHFDILDCDTNQVNLYGLQVDYVHGNALDLSHDGNVIISSRHLNEITKIDTETGEVIWRMGGNENEFILQGDDLWFTDQHGIREFKTDTISLFDNGNYHDPKFSRGVEYAINEDNMELTFIREYRHDPDIIVSTMGMMQKDAGKNAVIAWSRPTTEEVITEYHPDGSVAIEILCPNFSLPTYRVFKREWESNLFAFDTDTLDFGNIAVGDSADISFTLMNNSDEEFLIDHCFSSSPVFTLQTELPQSIQAGQQVEMEARFKPVFNSTYAGTLTFSTGTDTSRIAKQIVATGSSLQTGIDASVSRQMLRVFPNPASGNEICIASEYPIQFIELIDNRGLLLKHSPANNNYQHTIDMSGFDKGIYLVWVVHKDGTVLTEKFIN